MQTVETRAQRPSAVLALDTSRARKSRILRLLPEPCPRLLDVGCGPLTRGYPYAERAGHVTAVDWVLKVVEPLPANVTALHCDFTKEDPQGRDFDAIIAGDVFEHVLLEDEPVFARRCAELLRPGGTLIVSVPHAGRFAWLDPYGIKPGLERMAQRLGASRRLHNGTCDIRKGHRHYTIDELTAAFPDLRPVAIERWGRLYEPLSAWALSLEKRGLPIPLRGRLAAGLHREAETDQGDDAYSLAIAFRKPE